MLDKIGVAANVTQILSWVFGGSVIGLLVKMTQLWIRSIVQHVVEEIRTSTRQIQPGYRNGGESLADIAHRVQRLDHRTDELHEKVNYVARDFEHLRGRFDQYLENE